MMLHKTHTKGSAEEFQCYFIVKAQTDKVQVTLSDRHHAMYSLHSLIVVCVCVCVPRTEEEEFRSTAMAMAREDEGHFQRINK